MPAPFIIAFDAATSCGCCDGRPGDSKPRIWTWDCRDGGNGRPARLLYFSNFLDAYFLENQVDQVWYEAAMHVAVAVKIGVDNDTITFLHGMIALVERSAQAAGVPVIRSVDVKAARQLLTGKRTFPKDAKGKSTAKAAVMRHARMLGVDVDNDNESDSFAVWSYACAQADPRVAVMVTPLFGSADRSGGTRAR